MQGLVHYSDDSSPETSARTAGLDGAASPAAAAAVAVAGPSTNRKRPSGIVLTPTATTAASSTSRRSQHTGPASAAQAGNGNGNRKGKGKSRELPENLTHTAQSDLASSEIGGGPTSPSADQSSYSRSLAARLGLGPEFEGLGEDEIFKIVTAPKEIHEHHSQGGEVSEGHGQGSLDARGSLVPDWGIPPAVDPYLASDALKAKVDHFLRLKYEKGEHINTRLLSSSSFANPHIYSKLVEFVSIDERATAFPSSGWLTRRKLTSPSILAKYSPKAMSETQKRKAEQAKLAQAAGSRKEIGFTKAKHDDKPKSRVSEGGWDKDRDRNSHRKGEGGHRERDRDKKRERHDRERDRERDDRDRKRERR
ncbi:hypothetical protein IAU59_001883 [Kwoniella sp. CBS 9459]